MDFVYEVLFPYAHRNVREFVQQNYHAKDLQADISALKAEHRSDVEKSHEKASLPRVRARAPAVPVKELSCEPPAWREDSPDSEVESVAQYVYWLMNQDRKSKALKSLQGKIWEGGYLSGKLLGHVYPDVLPAFARWRKQQRAIYIFSSGSVLAQELLFAHTTDGDLTNYLGGYFDTTVGAKTNASSYRSISEAIAHSAPEVLFVSDVIAELDAAKNAGLETALCVRAADSPAKIAGHPIITTFDSIFP